MWSTKTYQNIALVPAMKKKRLSERALERAAGISRLTVRALKAHRDSRVSSWTQAAEPLGLSVYLVGASSDVDPSCSIQETGFRIRKDGGESWKIHLMNFVDEFRRTLDARLILLPPTNELEPRIWALLSSTVYFLSEELSIDPPEWCLKPTPLETPWFPSESEVLKPMMILESPLAFRRNGIYVGENFLDRA